MHHGRLYVQDVMTRSSAGETQHPFISPQQLSVVIMINPESLKCFD